MTATPPLFVALALVNITLAMMMMRITVGREREVEARERAVDALARAHEENLALQDQLLQQAHETGIAEERARLSRELHDTVAQGLVGVIRQLENLPSDLEPTARQRVERGPSRRRATVSPRPVGPSARWGRTSSRMSISWTPPVPWSRTGR